MNEVENITNIDEQSNLKKAIEEANQVKEALDLGQAEAKDYEALFGEPIEDEVNQMVEPVLEVKKEDPTANWIDLTNNVEINDSIETITEDDYDPFAKWNRFKNGDKIEIIPPTVLEKKEEITAPVINEQLTWVLDKDGNYEIVGIDNNLKYKIRALLTPITIGASQIIANNPIGKATKNGLNKIKNRMISFALKHNLIVDNNIEPIAEPFIEPTIKNDLNVQQEPTETNKIVEESPLNMMDGLKQIAVNQKLSLEAKILGGLVKVKEKKDMLVNDATNYIHTSIATVKKSKKDFIENTFNKKSDLETQIKDYREKLFTAANKAEVIDTPIIEQINEQQPINNIEQQVAERPVEQINEQKSTINVEPLVHVNPLPVIELLSAPTNMENQQIERTR